MQLQKDGIIPKDMAQPKGIDWKSVTFVSGHREDITPDHWRKNAYTRECEHCGAKAYLEIEYPLDVPVLCNVCASNTVTQLEQDSLTKLLYTMPTDLKPAYSISHRSEGFRLRTYAESS